MIARFLLPKALRRSGRSAVEDLCGSAVLFVTRQVDSLAAQHIGRTSVTARPTLPLVTERDLQRAWNASDVSLGEVARWIRPGVIGQGREVVPVENVQQVNAKHKRRVLWQLHALGHLQIDILVAQRVAWIPAGLVVGIVEAIGRAEGGAIGSYESLGRLEHQF